MFDGVSTTLSVLEAHQQQGIPSMVSTVPLQLSFPATRSHKDLAKDAAPHFRKAKKFYDVLATEMVGHGHICDIFSCALDNVSDTVQANERWDAMLASPLSYILNFSSICSDRN